MSGRTHVVAVDATGRSADLVRAIARRLQASGSAVTCLTGGTESALERAFDDALDCADGLDGLVVGVTLDGSRRRLLETSVAEWERAHRDALRGAFLVLRRGLGEILASGRGGRAILAIEAPRERATAGALALETALVSLVRALAVEYGRRSILCNGVLLDGPEAQLDALVFLVSGEASFVNGEVLDLRPA